MSVNAEGMATTEVRQAGDVEGHDFHGNQWTGGMGGGGGGERPEGQVRVPRYAGVAPSLAFDKVRVEAERNAATMYARFAQRQNEDYNGAALKAETARALGRRIDAALDPVLLANTNARDCGLLDVGRYGADVKYQFSVDADALSVEQWGKLNEAGHEGYSVSTAEVLSPNAGQMYVRDPQGVQIGEPFEASNPVYGNGVDPQQVIDIIEGDTPGGHELSAGNGIAAAFTDQWASTSGDSNVSAVAVQEIAAEHFGLDATAVRDYFTGHAADPSGTPYSVTKMEAALNERIDGLRPFATAYLDACRAQTAEVLAQQDIKPTDNVVLSRGFRSEDRVTGSQVGQPGSGYIPGGDTPVQTPIGTNPLSSFAVNVHSANNFGNYRVDLIVPASAILSTPWSGPGCLNENEVLILQPKGEHVTGDVYRPGY